MAKRKTTTPATKNPKNPTTAANARHRADRLADLRNPLSFVLPRIEGPKKYAKFGIDWPKDGSPVQGLIGHLYLPADQVDADAARIRVTIAVEGR